jgi:hypothetical protein
MAPSSLSTWPRCCERGSAIRVLHQVRKSPPPEDVYNCLQRLSYSGVLILAVVMVLSGLAIYKPVQFHLLTLVFGGESVRDEELSPRSSPQPTTTSRTGANDES